MDIQSILKVLPHRYPFLMIDRILELEPGKRAVGIKNVSINEPHFMGHWPDNPVMPGVLIVEAMAQTAGVAMLSATHAEGKQAFLGGLDKVRFRHPVAPGDQLRIEATLIKQRGNTGKVHITATVDDQVACEGDFTFVLISEASEQSETIS